MKLNVFSLLSFAGLAYAGLKRQDPPGCHADNCLRAIRATSQLAQASIDCSSFLLQTATPAPVTVVITSTIELAKRYGEPSGIPAYASACTDSAEYSSACSCIGVCPSTTTLAAASTTVVAIVTETPNCTGQTCGEGFIATCDPDNDDCYCFTDSYGDGFCGQNAVCDDLTDCNDDDDCTQGDGTSGDTCAFYTCCSDDDSGDIGVCLFGECPNPADKLRRMALGKRSHLVGNTAAFRAH